jgi:hypothetical protein
MLRAFPEEKDLLQDHATDPYDEGPSLIVHKHEKLRGDNYCSELQSKRTHEEPTR